MSTGTPHLPASFDADRAREPGFTPLPGVQQFGYRCWVIDGAKGEDHWPGRDALLRDGPEGDAVQLDAPCWTGSCASCGEPLGDDSEFEICHFDTAAEVEAHAEAHGWVLDGEYIYHEDCAPDEVRARMDEMEATIR